jgi:hypothetical protein
VNIPAVGNTITGATSGATGVVIKVLTRSVIITKRSATAFINTETVNVGATNIGILTPVDVVLSALDKAKYLALAADNYRADIVAVPGSGPVRGVVSAIFGGVDTTYAFRNNAGGTACILYKSSGTGWTLVPFYNEVSFTLGGPGIPADGDTLTQGANSATIKRVVLQTNSWPSSTATGRFIVTTPAPGNFAAGAATAGAVAVTLSGIQTVITLAPSGTFEFDVDNFVGQASGRRIYGCDGVNRGFEFDGDTLVPIVTGFSPDTPTHVKVHQLHLLYSFASSIGHSGPGFPYKWSAADGAGELACGDAITNIIEQPGNTSTAAIGITTRTDTLMLYGKSLLSWNLVDFNSGIGGLPFTGQMMNQGYWMAPHGVVDLHTTLNYGNFKGATLTTNVEPFIAEQRSKVAYSVLNRTKNQYRIFFTDKKALALTIINGKVAGMTKLLYTDQLHCAWSSTHFTLSERVFYGATATGHVYEADKGSSFDGVAIPAFLVFNWNHMGSPRIIKRMRKASLEMQGDLYAAFQFGYNLGYGDPSVAQPDMQVIETGLTDIPAWDEVAWDSFIWDGVTLIPSEISLDGSAVNIQPVIYTETDYMLPFTINSMIFHYSQRRPLR